MNSLQEQICAKYKELEAIQKGIDRANAVFKTYVGDEYFNSSERLMVVGKATAGSLRTDDEVDEVKEFVMEKIVERSYNNGRGSAFWRHAIELSLRFNGLLVNCKDKDELNIALRRDSEGGKRKKALERIAWSNIMKIGVNEGNPNKKAYRKQREVCVELLKLEFELYKPNRLVFVTGDDYLIDVLQVVNINSIECLGPDVYKLGHRLSVKECLVFLTRHPQGWTKDEKEKAIEAITS